MNNFNILLSKYTTISETHIRLKNFVKRGCINNTEYLISINIHKKRRSVDYMKSIVTELLTTYKWVQTVSLYKASFFLKIKKVYAYDFHKQI